MAKPLRLDIEGGWYLEKATPTGDFAIPHSEHLCPIGLNF
jgi:hypothetical protein